jgi:hypothetical protein
MRGKLPRHTRGKETGGELPGAERARWGLAGRGMAAGSLPDPVAVAMMALVGPRVVMPEDLIDLCRPMERVDVGGGGGFNLVA